MNPRLTNTTHRALNEAIRGIQEQAPSSGTRALVVKGKVVARGSRQKLLKAARQYGGLTDPRNPNGVFIAHTQKAVGEPWNVK